MIKYNVCDFFMIRTPLMAINDYLVMFDDVSLLDMNLKKAFDNPLLRETLAVSSKDLIDAIDKNDLDTRSKASEQIRSSLVKYFIRLSTRPTPFGLFSGISMGHFGDSSNLIVSESQCHTKRARPDMEWLYGLIKKIESDKNIRSHLRVRFNDFTYASGDRIEKPNKTFLQHDEGIENTQVLSTSIRYTGQVKMLEETCGEHRVFSGILDDIISQNPSVLPGRVEAFVSQLVENEFLLSELRPPLVNTDMLDYTISTLAKIEDVEVVDFYVSKLREIQASIAAYNATSVGNGLEVYGEILQLQKELYECKNYLQVDMKTHVGSNVLDGTLGKELGRFATAMCRLAPAGKMSDEQAHYVDLFLEKYGYSAEVPVLELLDVDKGLGAPRHFRVNTINRPVPQRQKPAKEQRLNALLDRKMLMALREGKRAIELTDSDIDFVCGDEKQPSADQMGYLQSFELYLLAHPGAEHHFTIAPMPMSDSFGKSFGRFSDMFSEDETSLLNSGFLHQKELFSEYIIAEIAELPSRGRTSNVSINSSDYDYQIALTTNPCEGKHLLSVRDLYVGIDRASNQFYIKSKSLDKKVVVTMTCMMNPSFGSSTLRFLREISSMRRASVSVGISGVLRSNFEYSPRITYGKVIIKPETWVISKDTFGISADKGKDKAAFEKKFAVHRQKWGISQYVFMNEADNRLLLDLDNPAHRNEIYNVLKRNTPVTVALTELGCDFDDYAAKSKDGKSYVTEIVVPFFASVKSENKSDKAAENTDIEVLKTISNVSVNRVKIERDKSMLLPGNEKWLYYKLYGGSKRQNELISAAHETLEKLVAGRLARKYFFIRYSDPEPHLRLRIQPVENGLGHLFLSVSKWLESLYSIGIISKVVSDSYMRETERYGGPELIECAEEYFFNDSKLVMNILTRQRYGELRMNMDYIGISFIISVLETFGLLIEEQEKFLSSASEKDSYRKEFQADRKMIMRAVDSRDDWFDIRSHTQNPEVYDLIRANSKALGQYANAVFEFDQRGELTNSVREITTSVIHMFCNRLMGNNAWERKIYALARHGVHGLKGFLKHNQKKAVHLELPDSLF